MRRNRGFTLTQKREVASHGRKASPRRLVSGFTLVEVLIYIAIFAVVAGMLSTVLITVIRTQNRDAASNEVANQLDFVLTTVQRLVRDASLVDIVYEGTSTSTACSTYCTMHLRMEDSTREPTIIRSDAAGVYLKEGASDEVALTTGKITVNNFNITKFETAGGHASVQIDASFTFNTNNPQLAVTKTLQSAISRVSAAVFDSDLIPNADNTWSIGQATMSWRDLILSNDLTVGGFVGIGTTAPDNLLSLNRASGDVILDFDIADADKWVLGVDNSDADKFKIESGGFLGGATPAFVITSAGNIGIGTASPGAKLEVAGQIKITGGAPGAGKVLTSDAAGLAAWEPPGSGMTAYGYARLNDSGTITSSETNFGDGSVETSDTSNMIWDSANSEFDITETGVYEVVLYATIKGSGTTSLRIRVDGVQKNIVTFYVHGSVDPVFRAVTWVGTVNNASSIKGSLDGSSNVNFELGSTFHVRKID